MSKFRYSFHFMLFKRIDPPHTIKNFIECYWVIDDENPIPIRQKIIPDGFPEIIFHYRDSYRIMITDKWELQTDFLLAGQITKFFFLENTGKTGVFGIKFKPTGLYQMFDFSMEKYNDKVVALNETNDAGLKTIRQILSGSNTHEDNILQLNSFFERLINTRQLAPGPVEHAVDAINKKKGMITVSELADISCLSERQFLNQFRRQVGLSPKFYARIIRLNYIFKLINEKREKWSSLAYEAAFFDQAHFIKDFKKFTGDNPSQYAFDEKNFANFFLLPDKK